MAIEPDRGEGGHGYRTDFKVEFPDPFDLDIELKRTTKPPKKLTPFLTPRRQQALTTLFERQPSAVVRDWKITAVQRRGRQPPEADEIWSVLDDLIEAAQELTAI